MTSINNGNPASSDIALDTASEVADIPSLSTDPSDIKNGINGFNLAKCSSPSETTAIVYIPNIGYGLPLNIYLSNKSSYKVDGNIGETPVYVAKQSNNRSIYSFNKKDFSYTEQDATTSDKLLSELLSENDEDDSIEVSVERVFQPRNLDTSNFISTFTLNNPCSKSYTLSDLHLPTPIFVKEVLNEVTGKPYSSLFDMPATPYGIDTFTYVAGELPDGTDEYGKDILSRTKKSSHMPIRRGEGVLSDIVDSIITSGECNKDFLGYKTAITTSLFESMKSDLIMKGDFSQDFNGGTVKYYPPYNDLLLMNRRSYADAEPSSVAAKSTIKAISGFEYDTDGNVSSITYDQHTMSSFYEPFFNEKDVETSNPSAKVINQLTRGLNYYDERESLLFTGPGVFVIQKEKSSALPRLYTNDAFTKEILKSITITGSSKAPMILAAPYSQHIVSTSVFSTDPLIEELEQTKIYRQGKYNENALAAYDKYVELLKGTDADNFPEIIKYSDIASPDLVWFSAENDISQEALFGTTSIENFLTGEYTNQGSFTTIADGLKEYGGVTSSAFKLIDYTNSSTAHNSMTTTTATAAKWYSYMLSFIDMSVVASLEETAKLITDLPESSFSYSYMQQNSAEVIQKIVDGIHDLTTAIRDIQSYTVSAGYSASELRTEWTDSSSSELETNIAKILSENTITIDSIDAINNELAAVVDLLETNTEDGITIGSCYLADNDIVDDSKSLIASGKRYYYMNDEEVGDIQIMPGAGAADLEVDEDAISIPLNYILSSDERKTISEEANADAGNIFITGSSFTGKNLVSTIEVDEEDETEETSLKIKKQKLKMLNVINLKDLVLKEMATSRSEDGMPVTDVYYLNQIIKHLNSVTETISGKTFFFPIDHPSEYSINDISDYLVNVRGSLVAELDLANKKIKYLKDEILYVDTQGTISYRKKGDLLSVTMTPSTGITLSAEVANVIDLYNMYFKKEDILEDPSKAELLLDESVYQDAMYTNFMLKVCGILAPVLNDMSPLLSSATTFQGSASTFENSLDSSYQRFATNVIDPYLKTVRDAMKVAIVYLHAIEMLLAICDRLMLEALFVNENVLLDTSLGGNFGNYFGTAPKSAYNLHLFHFMTKDGQPIYPIVDSKDGEYPVIDGGVGFRNITSLCSLAGKEKTGLHYKLAMDSPYYNEGQFKLNPVIFSGINYKNTGFWNCFADRKESESDIGVTEYSVRQYSPICMEQNNVGNEIELRSDTWNKDIQKQLEAISSIDHTALEKYSMNDLWTEASNQIDSPALLDAKIEGKLNVSTAIATSMKVSVSAKDSTIEISEEFQSDKPTTLSFPYIVSTATEFSEKVSSLTDDSSIARFLSSKGDSYTDVLKTVHSKKMLSYLMWDSAGTESASYYKSICTIGTSSYVINSIIAGNIAAPIVMLKSEEGAGAICGADSALIIPVLNIIVENSMRQVFSNNGLGSTETEELHNYIIETFSSAISGETINRFFPTEKSVIQSDERYTVYKNLSFSMNYNQMLSMYRALYSTYMVSDTTSNEEIINSKLFPEGKLSLTTFDPKADALSYSVSCLSIGVGGLLSPAKKIHMTEDDRTKQQSIITSVGTFTSSCQYGFPVSGNDQKPIFDKKEDEKTKMSGTIALSPERNVIVTSIAESTIFCPGKYSFVAADDTSFIPYNVSSSVPIDPKVKDDNTILGRIYLNHIIGILALDAVGKDSTVVTKISKETFLVNDIEGLCFEITLSGKNILTPQDIILPTIKLVEPDKTTSHLHALFYKALAGKEESAANIIGAFINKSAEAGKFSTTKNIVGEYKQTITEHVGGMINLLVSDAVSGTGSIVAKLITTRSFTPHFNGGE